MHGPCVVGGERTLSALKSLGEQSEARARAWSAVARRVASLPAPEARQYLEALRAAARPTAQSAVAELLHGSGVTTRQAPSLFLQEAEWLVRRPGLEEEALTLLAHKAETWRRALKAWSLHVTGARLDSRQEQLLRQLERLVEQLEDAAKPPRGKPFLVCTDKLGQETHKELQRLLLRNSIEVDVESMRELEMVATTRRLRAAFNLPEKLPGKEAGGTP